MTEESTAIKISVSYPDSHIIEDVIYYRYKMSVDFAIRWKWYFEYLVALVKVKHPRRHVILFIGRQDVKCGEDYITEKTISLLKHKRGALRKSQREAAAGDLFGFGEEDRQKKIDALTKEIDALENGDINFYVPPTYINKVKQWI